MKNGPIVSIDTGIDMLHYHGKADSVESFGRAGAKYRQADFQVEMCAVYVNLPHGAIMVN